METLQWLADATLHLDRHLVELVARYDLWIYALLFLIIFAETGLVVTPFLPGDSLLFACGALAAVDSSGTLKLSWLLLLLGLAAILGNTTNYHIGRFVGLRAFNGRHRFFRREHLRRAEQFFHRHGGFALIMSRFAPVVRTFTPFVAGISRMPIARFQLFNCIGASAWVILFIGGGFVFGNLPLVKNNFGLVTLAVVCVSLLPMLWMMFLEKPRNGASRG
jgi:membrane-associated protein